MEHLQWKERAKTQLYNRIEIKIEWKKVKTDRETYALNYNYYIYNMALFASLYNLYIYFRATYKSKTH